MRTNLTPLSDSLINVVTPTMEDARSSLGSSERASLTRSEVRDAIWFNVAMGLGSDACETPVDAAVVVKSARAFECNEVADTLEKSLENNRRVAAYVDAKLTPLKLKSNLELALRQCTRRPEYDQGNQILNLGNRKFKTRRGELCICAWEVLHPGNRALHSFYTKLQESSSPSLDTETIYKCSSETLNDASVKLASDLFFSCLKKISDL